MNELFRHYTAEHQLIEEEEVYTYQSSNKECIMRQRIYVDII